MNRGPLGITTTLIRGKDRGERGQALVEFVVVAPVIFVLLLGLFDVGRLVYINNELSHAAREGARWGAVQGRAATHASGANTGVSDAVGARVLVAPAPNITVGCTDIRTGGPACSSGDLLTVNISTSVAPITPLVGDLVGPLVLSSEVKMIIH